MHQDGLAVPAPVLTVDADVVDVDVFGPANADESEIEERRLRVAQLRMLRLTVRAIAKELNVDHSTIVRDMEHIRERSASYFKAAKINIGQKLGWLMSRLEIYEGEQYRMAHSTKTTMAQMLALKEAKQTALDQLNVLQDLGFVERYIGNMTVTLPRTSELRAIREALAKEPLFDADDPALAPVQAFIDVVVAKPDDTSTPAGSNGH